MEGKEGDGWVVGSDLHVFTFTWRWLGNVT